ncbi:MAG: amidohydrolase family protein [Chloroflexi bacterium]|nr:amidohydrolase family protein [Chloroflexota bacterium]
MTVVDAHVHTFPDAETGLVWQRRLGVPEPRRTGAVAELRGIMDQNGINHAVMLLYPRSLERYGELLQGAGVGADREAIRQTIRDEIDGLNRWGCSVAAEDERFLPFVGVNPCFQTEREYLAELDTLVEQGARGVKLIPPSMQMYASDRRLFPLYQRCWELKLPILSQSGVGGGPPPAPGADHYGRPRYWAEVLEIFPGLRVVLAHMALGYEDDLVSLMARFPSVVTDTSLRFSGLGKPGRSSAEQVVDLIRLVGVERVLLGSNYPATNPAVYAEILRQLPLSASEWESIASGNFERLMARDG